MATVAAQQTFIIDCPRCKAKVGASLCGEAFCEGVIVHLEEDGKEPFRERIRIGKCPKCEGLLVGESWQVAFAGVNFDFDVWSDDVRVYPKPAQSFLSNRIPKTLSDSLIQADRCLQANAILRHVSCLVGRLRHCAGII